jgi:hypothetical protein
MECWNFGIFITPTLHFTRVKHSISPGLHESKHCIILTQMALSSTKVPEKSSPPP